MDYAKDNGGIPQQDNHVLTFRPLANGDTTLVFLGRYDSSYKANRSTAFTSEIYEVPNADASTLRRLYPQNPYVIPVFHTLAAGSLDEPQGAKSGSPGLTTDLSHSLTVVNYDRFYPVLEGVDQNGLTNYAFTPAGRFFELWPGAAHTFPYPHPIR